jgi:hypothetical protein
VLRAVGNGIPLSKIQQAVAKSATSTVPARDPSTPRDAHLYRVPRRQARTPKRARGHIAMDCQQRGADRRRPLPCCARCGATPHGSDRHLQTRERETMSKQPKQPTEVTARPVEVAVRPNATFLERLDALRAANAQAHYDHALASRTDFDRRVVNLVTARVDQVLNAIVGD